MITEIYARWFWMTKFALVENREDSLIDLAYKMCVRMERLYGDIFADVREMVAKNFVRTESGQWACKFLVTGA